MPLKFNTAKLSKSVIVIVTSFILNACIVTENENNSSKQSTQQNNSDRNTFTPRAENQYLSQEQAFKRSARIANVSYELNFKLTGDESFSAISTVNFELNDNSTPLTLDINEAQITKLVINGEIIKAEKISEIYNNWFITLPAEQLNKGTNTVTVDLLANTVLMAKVCTVLKTPLMVKFTFILILNLLPRSKCLRYLISRILKLLLN